MHAVMGLPALQGHGRGPKSPLRSGVLRARMPQGPSMTSPCSLLACMQRILRSATAEYSGGTNQFGDEQLAVDVEVDNMMFERLRGCAAVEAASSEEQPDVLQMPGKGYTVAFDPLDGSSIIGANFAVGSIFGIWPGSVVGSTGRAQKAAAYAVYGPQTLLVWSRPRQGARRRR
jgi:sedoheptulose-bisphosphatase